jgi:hypothetical protein
MHAGQILTQSGDIVQPGTRSHRWSHPHCNKPSLTDRLATAAAATLGVTAVVAVLAFGHAVSSNWTGTIR